MKEMRNLLMLTLCMAVMGLSMASCLSDDDNKTTIKTLSPAEKSAMMANMAGLYSGQLFFMNDSARVDSVEVSCSVSAADSVFTVYDFPYEILTCGISSESVRNVLSIAGDGIFRDVLHFYVNNVDLQDYYTFRAIPNSENELQKTFTDSDEKQHSIRVKFSNQVTNVTPYGMTAVYYPIGEYRANKILVYILLGEIDVDGTKLTLNRVIYFYGKK